MYIYIYMYGGGGGTATPGQATQRSHAAASLVERVDSGKAASGAGASGKGAQHANTPTRAQACGSCKAEI